MGGSQLTQLKSKLNDSGLGRKSAGKKKKTGRRDGATDAQHRASKLAEITESVNPFDIKLTKQKHEVTGQKKVKGAVGRPGISKQVGIENRKKTLLVEYQNRNKAGGIIDRRFGEDNPHLTPEEKALERFTRERQRKSRGGGGGDMFNLADGDELTHYGQSLSFDDLGGGDVGLRDEVIAGPSDIHAFEEGDEERDDPDQPPRKKSKAEVMEEVIAKSKAYKYERQKTRDEDEEIRLSLDADLASIRGLLNPASSNKGARPRPPSPTSEDESEVEVEVEEDEEEGEEAEGPTGREEEAGISEPTSTSAIDRDLLRRIVGNDSEEEDDGAGAGGGGGGGGGAAGDGDEDEYDRYVRELVYERRAKPSDRLKTEEERAKEEREKLEKAERDRLRRMRGEPEEEDEGATRAKGKRKRGEGDDLEDDFVPDGEGDEEDEDIYGIGRGLASGAVAIEDSDEGGADEDDGEGQGSEVDEVSDEELEGMDEGDLVDLAPRLTPATRTEPSDTREVPFSFPCPESHDDLLEVLGSAQPEAILTVIERVRVLYHPKLSPENTNRLQGFVSVLIDHILYLASQDAPSFDVINSLIPHLHSFTSSYPQSTAQSFVSKLVLMQRNFVRGVTKGPLNAEAKTWPGIMELTFLRIVGLVWSASDFSHPVVAPALLLICQYLGQARVRDVRDIASGLFLCSLCAEYETLSKRFVPEAINFILNALLLLAPTKGDEPVPGTFPSPDVGRPELRHLAVKTKADVLPRPLNLVRCLTGADDGGFNVDLLSGTLKLVNTFVEMYASLEAYIEVFEPARIVLERVNLKSLPPSIQAQVKTTLQTLSRTLKLSQSSREPLQLQRHKPIPIPTYLPKFDEGFRPGRHNDPDSVRNEHNKLKALLKKEKKGAMRELRKDNRFLAGEKAKERATKDADYKSKIGRIMGSLETERAEEKDFERTKARERSKDKKRAGRR